MTVSSSELGLEKRIAEAMQLIEYSRDREAIRVLDAILREAPEHAECHLMMAQALTGANRPDEAQQHLELATSDKDQGPMAFGMLGYWHQARGHFRESRDCFEKSISLRPNQSVSYYGWSQSNRFGDTSRPIYESALRQVQGGQTTADDQMYLHYVLGKAEADYANYEASMHHYDVANAAAFRLLLNGKAFPRGEYASSIDAIIATFDKRFYQKHRTVGSKSRKPIFVVGMMRSGTTLVEQILSSHPEVGGAGEVDFWLDYGPSIFDSAKRNIQLRSLPHTIAQYLATLEATTPGHRMVTDKMPQNFQMLGLIHLAFPNAPIVHIRRHPVDTCISIWTNAYEKSPAFAHDRESIVFAYRQYQRLVAHWRKTLPPDRFFEVDYEELVASPESKSRELVRFCGLDWSEACLRPEKNDRLVTTPSLWQVRQPVYRSAVQRWKVYEPWLGAFAELL